jgi:hypothetical protein
MSREAIFFYPETHLKPKKGPAHTIVGGAKKFAERRQKIFLTAQWLIASNGAKINPTNLFG